VQISRLTSEELDACAAADASAALSLAASVERLLTQLDAHAERVARLDERPLSPDDRELSLATFVRVLDVAAALGALARTHLDFWQLSELADPSRCARHFALGFAAYLNELTLGLSFVRQTQGRAQFEILLDEGSDRHGIPPGAFARLKDAVLDTAHLARVFAARQYHDHVAQPHYQELTATHPATVALLDLIETRYAAASAHLGLESTLWVVANALDVLRDGAHRAILPVQAQVCAWLGDTRVRGRPPLISAAQVEQARRQCRPGDLLLQRRNWYLSNLGLPGFWPHLALWLGSPGELADELDGDPEVRAYCGGSLSARLEQLHPRAWSAYRSLDEAGHHRRVIEAVSEGVVFASAEHSLAADYAAALRPRLPKVEIARAVERAFEYAGLPYDFDFDCYSDRSVVCSELVYKAYEPRRDARGLRLELRRLAGRMTLPPNDLVAQLDRVWGSERQALDLVWFLDGRERTGAAEWADEASFRASHRRPKWDIAQD
jgi:hypothetical protein